MNPKELQIRGFELLCSQARIIALLPLEEWLDAFERAEAVAPIVDPTLYREYLASPKPDVLKDLIRAALPLKAAVMKAQAVIETLESPSTARGDT